MNIKNIFYYIYLRIIHNKIPFIFCLLLLSLSFFFIQYSIVIFSGLGLEDNRINKALSYEKERYGGICFDNDMNENDILDFISDIEKTGIIKTVGSQSGCAMYRDLFTVNSEENYWEYIKTIQNNNPRPISKEEDSGGVICFTANRAEYEFYEYQLIEGNSPNFFDGENIGLIYLGINFASVPVGTIFELGNYRMKVAGILSKDSYIIDEPSVFNDIYVGSESGVASSFTWNLNNMVLILDDEISSFWSNQGMFVCNSGYCYDDASDMIANMAEKKGVKVFTQNINDRLDITMKNSRKLQKHYAELGGLVALTTIIILISTNILRLLLKKNELAVWRINGFSEKNIFSIIFGENIFSVMLPGISASAFLWISYFNKLDGLTRKELEISFLLSMLVCLIIAVIISISVTVLTTKVIIHDLFSDLCEIER